MRAPERVLLLRAEEAEMADALSLSFADDEYMSLANTPALHDLYANAPKRMKRIAPREIGQNARRQGGFSWRRRCGASLLFVPSW